MADVILGCQNQPHGWGDPASQSQGFRPAADQSSHEQRLIEQARQGSLPAFNELILEYQDVIYRYAFWLLGEEDAAEDASQEVFLRVYKNLDKFGEGSFKGWLYKITTNICFDELRRQKHHPHLPLETQQDDDRGRDEPYWLVDTGKTPEELVETRETDARVIRCLQRLPNHYRAVMLLVDLQELDYREAASILGIPLGTVRSRLSRARLQFRSTYEMDGCPLPAAA